MGTVGFDLAGDMVLPRFPSTRFQGSKRKIVRELALAFRRLDFSSALDLYAGSGTVTLLLRALGKAVDSNDYLEFNARAAHLLASLTNEMLDLVSRDELAELVHTEPAQCPYHVARNYGGIFFLDAENRQIDNFCVNVAALGFEKRSIYTYAVGQALLMKRPYNLFHRANLDMRTRQVKRNFGNARTWETAILDHAWKIIAELKAFPFPPLAVPASKFYRANTAELGGIDGAYDLIYLDPPYLKGNGTPSDYCSYYHFLDGLWDYRLYADPITDYVYKPIRKLDTAWASLPAAEEELRRILDKWRDAIIFMSYRDDGCPSTARIVEIFRAGGRRAEVHTAAEYKYALSHADTTSEVFIVSDPGAS